MKRNYYNRYPTLNRTELVTPAGIARMYDMTPAAVSNWVTRYASFPAPVVVDDSGSVALWERAAVERWYNDTLVNSKKSISKRKK